MKRKVLFLVGPTASGKSKVALALAKKLKGEIISCDAFQVYKGMNIGTAKPTSAEQQQIPHHLINLISPRAEYSVFKHRQLALDAIDDILNRERLPIIVGGSGLYIKAIIDGLAPHPGKQTPLRKKFEAFTKKESVSSLYERLKKIDPKRAQQIHPNDKKRIIRAFEILESSGRSQADWETETQGLESLGIQPVVFGLMWDRQELYGRIEKRVDEMFEHGWLGEVKRLKRTGLSKTAKSAIGYQELLEYLKGDLILEDAILRIKQRTRNLAKKQATWFRRDKRICWIPVSGKRTMNAAIRLIVKELKNLRCHSEGVARRICDADPSLRSG